MSHFERLLEAAYTGPQSGTRISFIYRDPFTNEFEHRLDEYEYLGISGSEKRDLGLGPDVWPMVALFTGENHDRESARFIDLLRETITRTSPGIMEHPREGVKNVCIRGKVMKNMDVLNNANETTVAVTFEEQLIMPGQQVDSPQIQAVAQLGAFAENAGADYAALMSTAGTGETLAAKKSILDSVRKINETMSKFLSASGGALVKFNQIQDDIISNIDTLVKAPLTVAGQMQLMIGSIAAVPGNLTDKANLWADLYDNAIGTGEYPNDYYLDPNSANKNILANNQLVASACVANHAANISLNADQLTTTQRAYDALRTSTNFVYKFADDMDRIQESYYSELFQDQFFTSSKSFNEIKSLIRLSTAAIQTQVAGIKTSILLTTKRHRTILDICAEYYNDVSDETLIRFIDANKLSLSNVYIILAGTTVII